MSDLTISEAAIKVKVKEKTIYKWIREKGLPSKRIFNGKTWTSSVKEEDLTAFLNGDL